MAVFPPVENPKPSLLVNAGLTVSNGYKGSSNSETLLNLFVRAVEGGKTVEQLTVKPELEKSGSEKLDQFWVRINRFVTVSQQATNNLYWGMGEVFPLNTAEKQYVFADYYQTVDNVFGNVEKMSPNFVSLYRNFAPLFNRTETVENIIPTETIINYMLLNKSLRSEGVILPISDVFRCSLVWEKEDIFNILRKGTKLPEALRLHDIGFKTVEEVVEYAGSIPDSWIDLILE